MKRKLRSILLVLLLSVGALFNPVVGVLANRQNPEGCYEIWDREYLWHLFDVCPLRSP